MPSSTPPPLSLQLFINGQFCPPLLAQNATMPIINPATEEVRAAGDDF